MFKVSRPYVLTRLVIVINCLRLSIVPMAMVVMGDTRVQSITGIRTIRLLW